MLACVSVCVCVRMHMRTYDVGNLGSTATQRPGELRAKELLLHRCHPPRALQWCPSTVRLTALGAASEFLKNSLGFGLRVELGIFRALRPASPAASREGPEHLLRGLNNRTPF